MIDNTVPKLQPENWEAIKSYGRPAVRPAIRIVYNRSDNSGQPAIKASLPEIRASSCAIE